MQIVWNSKQLYYATQALSTKQCKKEKPTYQKQVPTSNLRMPAFLLQGKIFLYFLHPTPDIVFLFDYQTDRWRRKWCRKVSSCTEFTRIPLFQPKLFIKRVKRVIISSGIKRKKLDMPLPFSLKALMLTSLCYKQNLVFRLRAVRPAIAGYIAQIWKTQNPQLQDEVLLRVKEQKQ